MQKYYRSESRENAKLQNLTDKVKQLTFNLDKQTIQHRDSLDQRIKSVQETVLSEKQIHDAKINVFKQHILKTHQTLKKNHIDNQHTRYQQTTSLRQLNQILSNWLEEQKVINEEFIEKQRQETNQKLLDLCTHVQKQEKIWIQKYQSSYESANFRLIGLNKEIKIETTKRQQNTNRITQSIQNQLTKFHELIKQEEHFRKLSEQKISKMINDIELKIKKQIQIETIKRKQSNHALLSLIELACDKLEKKLV